ncbi:hypothetical protein B296_00000356 [Ensete ventricosum]|uniref:Uncharacterized protein n=1 Tax=Ensete ventricosum TaxID=4639 RepID=A0A426ZRT2_ENSVE|nr:hypothetical protein B296_00000356 [Ensete ventricosum]
MTVHRLAKVRERFCIPTEYELDVPLPRRTLMMHSQIASGGRSMLLRDLCEVDDRAGKDHYFVTQISNLSTLDAKGPLKPHLLNVTNTTRVWTEGSITAEYMQGALHPFLAKRLLEKMGQVTYEFGYRIALEHFRAKYPDSSVKEDPFDYGTPPED